MVAAGRAADDIRSAIAAAGGAIPFATFMDARPVRAVRVLHRPGGGRAGRRGDFLTSPEVGPLFGAVVARFLDAEWERLGRPDPFTVVDAGAGPGTLARAVLAAAPACRGAMRYVAVEVADGQRATHPAGVESRRRPAGRARSTASCWPTSCSTTCRSAWPCTTAGWRESFVTDAGDGTFAEVLAAPFARCRRQLPGQRRPRRAGAGAGRPPAAGSTPRRAIVRRGPGRRRRLRPADHGRAGGDPVAVVAADLPGPRAGRRLPRDAGRPGHHRRRGPRPAARARRRAQPGPVPPAPRDRRARRRGPPGVGRGGGAPDLAAMAMRSRVREAEALLDPSGLGGFTVLEWACP